MSEVDFDKVEEARRELARRELARRRYIHFVQRFSPDYQAGWVHKEIAEKLEQFMRDVEAKKGPRLMIFMPPRHGKSQLTSKTYAAWVLGHHPSWEFMECSYSAALASAFSRNVRGIVRDPVYQAMFPDTELDPSTQAVDEWMTTKGGQMVAAGVGGPITGKGAHIMLIDDPVKNREEAESPTTREAIFDWYTSTAYTRLAPGGGVLVIQTRWHDDDLSGRLIAAMKDGGDQWEVVQYPAIAMDDEANRQKGEALHPERYSLQSLQQIRRVVGDRDWWALYQQQPVSDDGAYFTKEMFPFYTPDELPKGEDLVFYTAWDLAIGTKEHNDYTVGITVGIDREENLWVVDLQRGHWDGLEIVEKVIDTWMRWKSLVTGIEKGQIQMAIGALMQKRIAERKAWALYIEELKTGRRDKQARARSIQGLMAQRRVKFPHPDQTPWMTGLMSECLRFPVAAHDDQVDALAWVGQMIVEMTPSVPPKPPKQKSWKDKLGPFITGGSNRHWLAA
jgi:predicted phage terminase large subunit-like protein